MTPLLDSWAVRLVAVDALGIAGVIGGHNLREVHRPAQDLRMARETKLPRMEHGGFGLDVAGGVYRQRTVARLAIDRRVPARLLDLSDVGVAFDARALPGEGDGPRAIVVERSRPVETVDAEIAGHQGPADHHEQCESAGKECQDSKDMLSVTKAFEHAMRGVSRTNALDEAAQEQERGQRVGTELHRRCR